MNKLQQAFYIFITNQLTSREEKAELLKVFKVLDKDNDGKISREELKMAYTSLESVIGPSDTDRIMSNLDSDGSGFIEYSEFITAAMNRDRVLTRDRIAECFKIFDKVHNA